MYFTFTANSVSFARTFTTKPHQFLHQLKILLALLTLAVTCPGQQYSFTHFGLNDGLPQSQVFALAEDQFGQIWMGTNGGGLAVYNGIDFKTYTTRQGLPANYILSLEVAPNGILWIGTTQGLAQFNGKELSADTTWPYKIPVTALYSDGQNRLWVGTRNGLFKKQGNSYAQQPFPGFANKEVIIHFIKQHASGAIWAGTNHGAFIIHRNETSRLSTKNGLSTNVIQSFGSDNHGNIWLGTYGYGVEQIHHQNIKNLNALTGLQGTAVFDMHYDSDGYLWLATQEKGLCRYNPADSSTSFFTEKDGLANNHARSLLKDRWGNLWIGTSGGGVNKYSGQQFKKLSKAQGLPGNYIYCVTADTSGRLWVGTSGGGINLYKDGRFTHFGRDSGFVNDKIRTAFVDNQNLLWLGIEGKGLATYNGQKFRYYNTNHGLAGNFVKSITQDVSGNIWVASAGGGITKVVKADSADTLLMFRKYNVQNVLSSNRVIQLHVDKMNRLWFATQTMGIGYLTNDTSAHYFSKKEGLSSNDVRSITEDKWGNLWVGSTTGLNYIPLYREKMNIGDVPPSKLSSTNIYQLTADTAGYIYVGTEKGIDRLKTDESGTVLETTHYGSDEGFTGVETNLNAAYLANDNHIWFGTVDGLFQFQNHAEVKNLLPPILNFSAIHLNHISLEKTTYKVKYVNASNLKFEPNENHISFDFLGITQTIPAKVKYKWRLVGLEGDWSPAAKRNSVTYSNLAPGQYVFEVLSANENDVWNSEPLRFPFEIKSPFWQKSWFRVVLLFGALLFIVMITAVIIRQINKKSKERQEKLKVERDLISLEQKALRLQMNPHFIFHTLNNIQSLIATKDEDTARVYLSKFSKLMRQILENSRSSEVTLENEIETLENYLNIERFCHDNSFDFTIEVAENLETAFINIPPMILQPFVENAIVHGVAPLQGGGRIHISFTEKKGQLTCTITDNGIGRKAAAQRIDANHKSTALAVTQQRLAMLNPDEESVAIEDLEVGTRVVVRFS